MVDPITPVVAKGISQGVIAKVTLGALLGRGDKKFYNQVLEHLRDRTCQAQLDICDYQTALAVRNDSLRTALLKEEDSDRKRTLKINALYDELAEFNSVRFNVYGYMKQFVKNGLKDYFRIVGRSAGCSPRVCIKLFTGEKIVDVLRNEADRPKGYEELTVEENTAFKKIYDGSRAVVQNNIPLAARNKTPYVNARLAGVQNWDEYKPPGLYARWKMGRLENKHCDDKWRQCWKDGHEQERHYKSFYKSTLVVPMTMRKQMGSFLSTDSQKKLVDDNTTEETKIGKLLYGFICVDHVQANFFSPKPDKDSLQNSSDVNVAILFADLMTILCVQLELLTTSTSYYTGAHEYLKANDSSGYSERIINTTPRGDS